MVSVEIMSSRTTITTFDACAIDRITSYLVHTHARTHVYVFVKHTKCVSAFQKCEVAVPLPRVHKYPDRFGNVDISEYIPFQFGRFTSAMTLMAIKF